MTGLTLSSLTRAIVLLPDARFESDPWFTNQRCVQCALGNPTHNSAMVTEGMKTSALWQQINGSLSPRISRTLNKIWHNSIILKQALSEHTLSREMQERKVLRRTASQAAESFDSLCQHFESSSDCLLWASVRLKGSSRHIVCYSFCVSKKRQLCSFSSI